MTAGGSAALLRSGPVDAPAPTRGSIRRRRQVLDHLLTLPFLAFVAVFLLWPTLAVVGGAFSDGAGGLTLANVTGIFRSPYREAFVRSIELSAITAVVGAVLGAALAWAVVSGRPDSALRRFVTSVASVLAQFGGVPLAFAYLATIGFEGLVTVFLRDHAGLDIFAGSAWIFELPGLVLLYSYFQIPLMVIVFLPALDGLRPQWREASESLGGTGWTYLRHVAGPILTPAFTGSTLLLFANAFSAYATAAVLISQGATLIPLQIRALQTGEVLLGQQGQGKALGLGMIVVVAVVMTVYALLQRRTSRWLR